MSQTFSRVNSSAATLTKNRTEDSVTPGSGMCVTCVDGCIGMCEIGKSAFRGHEVIYPQPFGVITTASEKTYPVDYSHLNILGYALGAEGLTGGLKANPDDCIFPNREPAQNNAVTPQRGALFDTRLFKRPAVVQSAARITVV